MFYYVNFKNEYLQTNKITFKLDLCGENPLTQNEKLC